MQGNGQAMTAHASTQSDTVLPLTQPRAQRLSSLRAEEQLLLFTAGGVDNDEAIRVAARGTIDWPRFLGLAQFERAVPVMFPRLRALVPDAIPAPVFDQMRRLAMVSDFAMLNLEARLRESLAALHDAKVRVMLLKGAALTRTAYSSVCQRPMSDVDVLVDASNIRLARQAMLSAGWCDIVGGIPDSVYDRHHHLPPLRDVRSPDLQLEIHTALFPERQPFAFDVRDLWAGAKPLGAAFPEAYVPDRVHLLLHACLHFLWSHQARFGVWRTLRDIGALTRNASMDWDAFVGVAKASRGATACYWTFRIAGVVAGIPIPAAVMAALRPPRSTYALQAIERHFLRNLFPIDFACPSVTLDHALWEFAVMPGWSGHGEVRPWDQEPDFVIPSEKQESTRILPKRERVRRLLASPGYIRTLLRPRG
jgi:hypothetical protein